MSNLLIEQIRRNAKILQSREGKKQYDKYKKKAINKDKDSILSKAFEMFEKHSKANLFIVILKEVVDGSGNTRKNLSQDKVPNSRIYFFRKQKSPLASDTGIMVSEVKKIKNLWKDIKKIILDTQKGDDEVEEGMKKCREDLKKFLLKEKEIGNEFHGMTVWVYCKDKENEEIFNPLWEWIYTDGRYWGDEYHIVRISEKCEFKLPEENSQIENVAMIYDHKCSCKSEEGKCFGNLPSVTHISLFDIENGPNQNLKKFDCIHLVATGGNITEQLLGSCRLALQDCKQLKFLFLNIRTEDISTSNEDPSTPNLEYITELKKMFSDLAEIWIDTTLDLPDEPAPHFVKCFYTFRGKNVINAATETRKNIDVNGVRLNLGHKRFWRHAYVVKGNPCTKITWASA